MAGIINWKIFLERREQEFSSTQINLSKDISDKIISWGQDNISDEELYNKEGFGREDTIHVTVLFGLHIVTPILVRKIIKDFPAIRTTLGRISIFESEEYDVVKIDIHGNDLHLLNKKLSDLPHTKTHPRYYPHVTIAYVKKGCGKKFVGDKEFEYTKIILNDFVFSSKDRKYTHIKLKD